MLSFVATFGIAAERSQAPRPVNPDKGDEIEISSHLPSAVPVPDNLYDGTLASMACLDVPGSNVTITDLDVQLNLAHTWVGDLAIKLVSPSAEILTLMSRPGLAEPADDGTDCCGDSSNLLTTSPIMFDDAAAISAEDMGTTLGTDGVICQDDGECTFAPAPDTGPGTNLAQFNTQNGAGTWQVCVGDSGGGDTGDLDSAVLIFNGLTGDLGVTLDAPGGVAVDGPFDYQIAVTNNGPGDQSGVTVTDTLEAGLTYVSDSCGGTAAGQTWTWNAGSLVGGASTSCTLTVQATSASCAFITNTVSVTGAGADLNSANNSASHINSQLEQVQDPSFEGGTPSAAWTEASTNFGTPICDAGCGDFVPPTTGDWYVFFGGINGLEEGSVEQSITIPPGALLRFQHVIPNSSGNGTDFMRVLIDGNEVFSVLENDPTYVGSAYQLVQVDLAGYDDGGTHLLRIESTCNQPDGQSTFFFVDDVSVDVPACATSVARAEVPTLSTLGAMLLGLLLAGAGLMLVRRRL
jgi:uncharacterized repeat protein (TIGR01451 family)